MQKLWILRTAEVKVKKLFLTGVAALFLATGAAHAQSNYTGGSFFGPTSGSSVHSVYTGRQYYVRPINISPTTGRTYSTEADYKTRRRPKNR